MAVAPDDGLRVVEGDADAETLVELAEQAFSDFLNELLTASGAVRTGRARVVRGSLAGWQRWEPASKRCASGRPIFGPAVAGTALSTATARPLDLHRSFTVDDPRARSASSS